MSSALPARSLPPDAAAGNVSAMDTTPWRQDGSEKCIVMDRRRHHKLGATRDAEARTTGGVVAADTSTPAAVVTVDREQELSRRCATLVSGEYMPATLSAITVACGDTARLSASILRRASSSASCKRLTGRCVHAALEAATDHAL